MRPVEALLFVTLGGVAGIGLGMPVWQAPAAPATPGASEQASQTDAGAAAPDCPTRPSLEAKIEAVRARSRLLSIQANALESRTREVEGDPIEWTDDLPESARQDAVEAALADALARSEATELIELDCSEFPCIALVATPVPYATFAESAEAGLRRTRKLLTGDAYPSLFAPGEGMHTGGADFGEGTHVVLFSAMSFTHQPPTDEQMTRIEARSGVLLEDSDGFAHDLLPAPP